jgi:hypothetical protein
MRDVREDLEADFDKFARSLAWSDGITYALTLPFLALMVWWLLQR